MTVLLEIKEKMKQIYAEYGTFLFPILKFVLAFIVFKSINSILPFSEVLNSIFILLILALFCAILPLNVMVLLGMVLIVGQCYEIGIEVAAFALALILVMFILYIRFTPGDALILILTPIACYMKVPCVIPIGCGLTRSPASAVSAGFGVVIYYFMELVKQKVAILQGAETKEIAQNLKLLLDGLLKNQNMFMSIIAFVAVLLIVYVIHRLSIDYAWQIAILSGAISYIVIMIAGGLFIDVKSQILSLIFGTVGSVILAEGLEFFLFNVDYTRAETLQYEDDEYYYYVKAVPKMSIAEKNVTIKTIQAEEEDNVRTYEPPIHPYQPGPVPQETIAFEGISGAAVQPQDERQPQNSEDISIENIDFEEKLEQSLKEL